MFLQGKCYGSSRTGQPETDMAKYKKTLKDKQISDVVIYIRESWVK
jgi:hypothetical protein